MYCAPFLQSTCKSGKSGLSKVAWVWTIIMCFCVSSHFLRALLKMQKVAWGSGLRSYRGMLPFKYGATESLCTRSLRNRLDDLYSLFSTACVRSTGRQACRLAGWKAGTVGCRAGCDIENQIEKDLRQMSTAREREREERRSLKARDGKGKRSPLPFLFPSRYVKARPWRVTKYIRLCLLKIIKIGGWNNLCLCMWNWKFVVFHVHALKTRPNPSLFLTFLTSNPTLGHSNPYSKEARREKFAPVLL
jgi:hypothetical protein